MNRKPLLNIYVKPINKKLITTKTATKQKGGKISFLPQYIFKKTHSKHYPRRFI